jgi:hypothetical protein
MNDRHQQTKKRSMSWIFFLILIIVGLRWVWHVYQYGDVAFGYDTGIYRHIVQAYGDAGLSSDTPQFALSYVTTPLRMLGLSADSILFGGYISIVLFTITALFVFARTFFPSRAALFLILVSTSLIFNEFLYAFYVRNLLGIGCLAMLWSLLKKEKPILVLPTALVALLHPISAVFGLLVSFAYSVWTDHSKKWVVLQFTITAACFLLISPELMRYAQDMALNISRQSQGIATTEFTGQFLPFARALTFMTAYLVFSIIGIVKHWKTQPMLLSILMVSFLWIALSLPFQHRTIVFIDLALIAFAALGATSIHDVSVQSFGRVVAPAFLVALFVGLYLFQATLFTPLLSRNAMVRVHGLRTYIPSNSAVLSYSSREAPWLLGYVYPTPVIAPGMFEFHEWSYDDWMSFWRTTDEKKRHDLLDKYDFGTLFIFVGASDQFRVLDSFSKDKRLNKIDDGIWQYSQ